jgi:sensor histidine kinase YesM
MPTWLTEALRQGGLFAVAVVCVAVMIATVRIFHGMWRTERDRNDTLTASILDKLGAFAKTLGELTNSNNRQADALDAMADEVQRTREDQLRYRLESSKGAGK